jgi:hypothetical protein
MKIGFFQIDILRDILGLVLKNLLKSKESESYA